MKLNCVVYKNRRGGEFGKVFWYTDEMLLVERKKGNWNAFELKTGWSD